MRVNIDDKLQTDPRITLAAARLDMTRFEFIGRVIWVWMAAYQNRSPFMPARNVDALAQFDGFVDAMMAEDLATPMSDSPAVVRLRGVTERIEFLLIQDAKREKANAAKRAKAGLPPARAGAAPPGAPYSHSQPPPPTHGQARSLALSQDRDMAHTHKTRTASGMFVCVPPLKKGSAEEADAWEVITKGIGKYTGLNKSTAKERGHIAMLLRDGYTKEQLIKLAHYLADEGGENWYGKIDENYNNYLRGHLVVATVYSDKHIEKYLAAADSDCWSYETYFPAQEPSEPTPPGMPF